MLGEQSIGVPPRQSRVSALVKHQKFLIGGLILLLAVGYLIATSMQNTSVYYFTISEVQARTLAPGENVRVNGKVTDGTISMESTAAGARFVMHDENDPSRTMTVNYKGLVPDTFKDGSEVVVEGKLLPSGEFEANTLLAKCPSKFTAENAS